jgi:hypothetical protein
MKLCAALTSKERDTLAEHSLLKSWFFSGIKIRNVQHFEILFLDSVDATALLRRSLIRPTGQSFGSQ